MKKPRITISFNHSELEKILDHIPYDTLLGVKLEKNMKKLHKKVAAWVGNEKVFKNKIKRLRKSMTTINGHY